MNLWDRFRQGLTRTREKLEEGLGAVMGRGAVDPDTRERLESALLAADVGPATTDRLIEAADSRLKRGLEADLRAALEKAAAEILGRKRARLEPGAEKPWVVLIMGVNGTGKTTLAGKLAAHFARAGRPTLLVAGDTFRAAASEQLDVWAGRAGVELVRAKDGSDPAAVVHDGLAAAKTRGAEVVLVDTAGRLHTRHNLMAELEKVVRVMGRAIPGAPHHVLLVLDGTLGQNGVAQAREFGKTVPVTSLAVNKLDGTARGGAVLAIAAELELPVSVVGLGEGLEDWEPFDPEAFARGLFD